MDDEASKEFLELLVGLTPEQTQWIIDRATIGIAVRTGELGTFRDVLRVCTQEAVESIIETLKDISPACYCGHKKIFHEIGGFHCAIPHCQCMCFHEV